MKNLETEVEREGLEAEKRMKLEEKMGTDLVPSGGTATEQ
jgi:hypothetical protein